MAYNLSQGYKNGPLDLVPIPGFERLESEFEYEYYKRWFETKWYYSIYISLGYCAMVYLGLEMMKRRPPFELRVPMAIWSGVLALFSIAATSRALPELLHVLYNYGFRHSICERTYFHEPRLLFWGWLTAWSKVAEFGDTMFIILRKQRLIHLHWLHHAVTCVVIFAYGYNNASGRWYAAMNLFVHSIMYTYYMLKALRIRVPRGIAMSITIVQIVQMIAGLAINYITHQMAVNGVSDCHNELWAVRLGLTVYLIMFFLFCNYFFNSYLSKPVSVQISVTQGKAKHSLSKKLS